MGPGVANLLSIFQAFTDWTDDADARALRRHALRRSEEAGGRDGGRRSSSRSSSAIARSPPSPATWRAMLREGAERVTPIANSTVELVKRRMGLYTESVTCRLARRLLAPASRQPELPAAVAGADRQRDRRLVLLGGHLQPASGTDRQRDSWSGCAFVLQVLPQTFAAPTAGVINDRISRKQRHDRRRSGARRRSCSG